MIVFEIIAALLITLSLGVMLNADTRDNRIRVAHQDAKDRFRNHSQDRL